MSFILVAEKGMKEREMTGGAGFGISLRSYYLRYRRYADEKRCGKISR
jgi:hypothetical protein